MNQVLFVDDEALILNSLKRGLMDEPYGKFFATSGEQALQILRNNTISVLITDMKMPGMSGLDLLKAVKEDYPDMVKLVLSGYTQLPQVLVTVNQGDIFKFVTKPWDLENEFKGIIWEAIDYYNYKIELKKGREALEKKNITFQNILKTYDDKLVSMRDEVIFLKTMSERLLKDILKDVHRWNPKTSGKEMLLDEIIKREQILLDVFELIPSQVKRFNAKQLIEDMRKYVVDQQRLAHFEFGMDEKMRTLIKGRYDLLVFCIKKLIDLQIVESFDARIGIIISGTELNESEFLLKVVVDAETKWFDRGAEAETTFKWLAEWITGFGGELLSRDMGLRRVLVLNMMCEC